MADDDRRVRQLRLVAPSADAARALLPRLEDALRCASLPGSGQRLLLVRRLALGRVAPRASAQALARLIERRLAEAAPQWVAGGTPAASCAGCVAFASDFEARVQLALRLLRRQPCADWYWPRAVPEFVAARGDAANLRAIAAALAALPEARVALPAWLARIVEGGAGATLAATIDEAAGEKLLRAAAIVPAADESPPPQHHVVRTGAGAGPASSASQVSRRGRAAPAPRPGLPRWLRAALAAAPTTASTTVLTAVPTTAPLPGAAPGSQAAASDSPHSAAGPVATRRSPSSRDRAAAHAAVADRTPSGPQRTTAIAAARRVDGTAEGAAAASAAVLHAPPPHAVQAGDLPALDRSNCAGLCFLLPVLARLGLPDWCAEVDGRFADRVLRAALQRLRVAPDDPAWRISGQPPPRPRVDRPAPAVWQQPALAPPRGRRPRPDATQALAAAGDADAQARVWLDVARRWLRRVARIGLASLLQREGLLALTPTHVDLCFDLRNSDLRVRRAGLDIDPGWLPWLGRVVAFHYEEGWP